MFQRVRLCAMQVQVLSWAGKRDESVALLGQVLQLPIVGQPFIRFDPARYLPLAVKDSDRNLVAVLESRIRHCRKELASTESA